MSKRSDTAITLMKMALALLDRRDRKEATTHLRRAIEAAEHARDKLGTRSRDRTRC